MPHGDAVDERPETNALNNPGNGEFTPQDMSRPSKLMPPFALLTASSMESLSLPFFGANFPPNPRFLRLNLGDNSLVIDKL
jgi:hypothetical protein